jgi:hypothetical protein
MHAVIVSRKNGMEHLVKKDMLHKVKGYARIIQSARKNDQFVCRHVSA